MKPWGQLAHGCLSWFPQHEAARSISTPPGWDASPSQVTPPQFVRSPQQLFTSTHLYFWVERGTVRVKCLAKNKTQCPQPGHKPRPLTPGTSKLPCLPLQNLHSVSNDAHCPLSYYLHDTHYLQLLHVTQESCFGYR